ncbi:MAG TPA: hypothetical protein VEC36_03630 [Patescibacteria group bacterium]|nr:hypothetical protein [Patescibacteria group bacterium]
MRKLIVTLCCCISMISCQDQPTNNTDSGLTNQEVQESVPGSWIFTPSSIDTARNSKGGSLPVNLNVFESSISYAPDSNDSLYRNKKAVGLYVRGLTGGKYIISFSGSGFTAYNPKVDNVNTIERMYGQFKNADNWTGAIENTTSRNSSKTGFTLHFTAQRKK